MKPMSAEAHRLLNHLASMPGLAHGTITRDDLRATMLHTGGQLMAQGRLYNIASKHLGAGVYKLFLKLEES